MADDHPGFPEVEERLLEHEFEIVAKVRNGQALIEQAIQLEPDVIVTDISMPILNGIAAVQRLRDSKCKSQIIFLTVHADRDFVRMCLSTGALGYVLKPRMAKELKRAIHAVLEGRMFVSPDLRHETAS